MTALAFLLAVTFMLAVACLLGVVQWVVARHRPDLVWGKR